MVIKDDADKTAMFLDNIITKSGYNNEDYFIYALTGTADIAYENMTIQIEAMKNFPSSFIFPSLSSPYGNIMYKVKEGGTHDYTNIRQYIYNALPTFWR